MVADVEAVVAREGAPIHFAPAAGYEVDDTFGERLRPAERRSREELIAAAESYYDTLERTPKDSARWVQELIATHRTP